MAHCPSVSAVCPLLAAHSLFTLTLFSWHSLAASLTVPFPRCSQRFWCLGIGLVPPHFVIVIYVSIIS